MTLFVAHLPTSRKTYTKNTRSFYNMADKGDFLEFQQSDMQILVDLGLTLLQAKVYLALARSEPTNAITISQLAKVARPDVYRTLSKLHNLGLVEEIIEAPRRYKAIPMTRGLAFLLKRKTEEHDMLRKKTERLLRTFQKEDTSQKIRVGSGTFVLIPKKERIVNRIKRAIDDSQETVDLVLSLKRFMFGITVAFAESTERAWDRGVKFRIIVEKPEAANTAEMVTEFCGKSPCCNIRFLPGRPKTVIGIYDSNEAFLIVSPGEGLFDSPALWSNNLSLLTVVQDYFNIMWLTAMEKL
jgi:sugar-specific transcriptional regulator TrmB